MFFNFLKYSFVVILQIKNKMHKRIDTRKNSLPMVLTINNTKRQDSFHNFQFKIYSEYYEYLSELLNKIDLLRETKEQEFQNSYGQFLGENRQSNIYYVFEPIYDELNDLRIKVTKRVDDLYSKVQNGKMQSF